MSEDVNKYSIEVTDLVKQFGDFTAVKGVSFSVRQGSIFAFLGPNGAGKTTTIKMLTTLLKPTSGTVQLNGIDPTKNQDTARKSFGIVFQDQSVDEELTAYENMYFHAMLYGVERIRAQAMITELLTEFELIERKDSLVKEFSGGMRRRLEIARSFLHEPNIIFLDEPTLGLDPQTRAKLWAHVLKLNKEKGVTVFLTTHYMEEAERMADQVAVIDHGAILAQGTVDEIKEEAGAETLEQAFLDMTGRDIRESEATGLERMRNFKRRR